MTDITVHDDGRMAPVFGSDEHTKCLTHFNGRLAQGEQQQNLIVPAWIENYKAFRAMPTAASVTGKADWQSDIRNPYVAEQVLTMLPRLVEGKPAVDILRMDPSDPADVERVQRRWMTHTLWLDGFPMKAARVALNTILFGVGWSMQSYYREQVTRTLLNPETGLGERKKLTVASRPTMSVPHPMDVMWDPTAETMETARYVITRKFVSLAQLRSQERREVDTPDGTGSKWVGRYSNTEHVKGTGKDRSDWQLPNEIDVPNYVLARGGGSRVELLQLLDKELDRIVVVANRQVIVRDTPLANLHGQLPIAAAVTTPDVQRLNGIAEVDWIRPLQEMLWLLENQRLDNTRLQMDMVLLVRDTIMELDDYKQAPGAKWAVQNPDDVTVLQYPQPQLASVGDMEMLRGRLQAIIGSAYMTGGDASGVNQDTASGLMSIIEEGNRRVDFRMNLMTLFYDRVLMQMLSDGAQYITAADRLFVPGAKPGEDPIPVAPDVLAAKSWVQVRMSSETGMRSLRQQMAQGLMQAAQMFQGTPIPTANGIMAFNPMPIIETVADAYDKEPSEFLFDMQALQAKQQQEQMAAAASAQAQQAGNPTQVVMPGGGTPLPANAPVGSIEGK